MIVQSIDVSSFQSTTFNTTDLNFGLDAAIASFFFH